MKEDWEGETVRTYAVPVLTLDQAIRDLGRPHYCKIDVEGSEFDVLCTLDQPLPLVSFEYHLYPETIETTRKCLNHLATLGSIAVNMTGAEDPALLFTDWLPLANFWKRFDAYADGRAPGSYGDIFVRTAT